MQKVIYLPILLVSIAAIGIFLWGFMPSKASNLPLANITVIAKSMNFNESNPSIVIKRGQTVQLTVKNEDQPGMYHDFSVPALGVKTKLLRPGETETLTFTADHEGTFIYTCPFHPKMMLGKVIVE